MPDERKPAPFNTPLETGIRSVGIHTGDIGGPASLYPELPMRSAELLVTRGLVERGLLLMISGGWVREANARGIFYRAGEFAETFIPALPALLSLYYKGRHGSWKPSARWRTMPFAKR